MTENDTNLRDLFAIQILNGMLVNAGRYDGWGNELTDLAYELADLMLEARKL